MSGCAIRTGFFVLRRCDQPVVATCSVCQRSVCKVHLLQSTEEKSCLECAAKYPTSDKSRDGRWEFAMRKKHGNLPGWPPDPAAVLALADGVAFDFADAQTFAEPDATDQGDDDESGVEGDLAAS